MAAQEGHLLTCSHGSLLFPKTVTDQSLIDDVIRIAGFQPNIFKSDQISEILSVLIDKIKAAQSDKKQFEPAALSRLTLAITERINSIFSNQDLITSERLSFLIGFKSVLSYSNYHPALYRIIRDAVRKCPSSVSVKNIILLSELSSYIAINTLRLFKRA